MKAFIYEGELYIRAIPSKNLFRSTMVHDVVNRGNIFAINVATQQLTIIPGKSEVEHCEVSCVGGSKKPLDTEVAVCNTRTMPSAVKKELAELRIRLAAPKFVVGNRVRLRWWSVGSSVIVRAHKVGEDKEHRYQLTGFGTWYNEHDLEKA